MFDVTTDEAAVAMVTEMIGKGMTARQISDAMVQHAVQAGSRDNITVMVVILDSATSATSPGSPGSPANQIRRVVSAAERAALWRSLEVSLEKHIETKEYERQWKVCCESAWCMGEEEEQRPVNEEGRRRERGEGRAKQEHVLRFFAGTGKSE